MEVITISDSRVTASDFKRDRLTHLNYALVGTFAFMAVIIGPILPSLRTSFGLSYTLAGLVPATLAAGVAIAGVIAARLMSALGSSKTCWLAAAIVGLSASSLALAPVAAVLFVSLFFMGASGGVLLSVTSSTLASHHGDHQATAVVEANVAAGVASLLAPVAVAVSQHSGAGWRLPLFIPALAIGGLYIAFGSEKFATSHGTASQSTSTHKGRLPGDYWVCWLLLVVVVALETGLNVWGVQYFQTVVGLSHSTALLAPVVFYIAFLCSRIIGSFLTRKYSETVLVKLALCITLVGVVIYCAVPVEVPAMAGFAIAGFGVANLWPLTLSLAIHTGKRKGLGELAASRASAASGASTLTIPPTLGAIADGFGLHVSQVAIVVLAAAGLVLVSRVRR